jgi:lipopolysaccharide export system protein LptC
MADLQMTYPASWQDAGAPLTTSARRKAFGAARRHSRLVRVLRILLPVAGVAGIAAFVVLTQLGLPGALDLSSARLSVTPNAVIMEQPNLSGFDGDGHGYSVRAARAVQPLTNPDQVRLEEIAATLTAAGQGATTVSAASGEYNHGERTLRLEGGIAVKSSEGYALRMTDVDIDFRAGSMQSDSPVTVTYADSEITAERFLATEGGRLLLFEGGVRTVVTPPKHDAAAEPAQAGE